MIDLVKLFMDLGPNHFVKPIDVTLHDLRVSLVKLKGAVEVLSFSSSEHFVHVSGLIRISLNLHRPVVTEIKEVVYL